MELRGGEGAGDWDGRRVEEEEGEGNRVGREGEKRKEETRTWGLRLRGLARGKNGGVGRS